MQHKKHFFEKRYRKCEGETIASLFSKKLKLSISLNYSKVFCRLFLMYAMLWAIKIDWNYAADHLLLPLLKLF